MADNSSSSEGLLFLTDVPGVLDAENLGGPATVSIGAFES